MKTETREFATLLGSQNLYVTYEMTIYKDETPVLHVVDIEDTDTGKQVERWQLEPDEVQVLYKRCKEDFRSPRPKTQNKTT